MIAGAVVFGFSAQTLAAIASEAAAQKRALPFEEDISASYRLKSYPWQASDRSLLDLTKHLEIPANKAANLFNIDQPASRNTQLHARVQLIDGGRNCNILSRSWTIFMQPVLVFKQNVQQ
jgi:hypothetical protein